MNSIEKFIKLTKGRKFWPIMNSYTFFGQGSAFTIKKYFKNYYPDLPPFHLIMIAREGESMQLLPSDTLEYCSRYIFKEYLNGSKEAEKRFYDFDATEIYISSMHEEYTSKKISEMSNTELLKIINKLRDEIWQLNGYIFFTVYFDKNICLDVIKDANFPISQKQLELIWEKSTHPACESFEKAQQRIVLNAITKDASHKEIIEKARFIFANYFGVDDIDNVAKKIDAEYGNITKDQAIIKLDTMNAELENEKEKFNTWFQALSKEEQIITWYTQRIIEYRDRRKNIFMQAYVIWWMVYEKLLLEAGLDHSVITYIQFDEILNEVEYLKSHRDEIESRKNGSALLIEYDGTITIEPVDYATAKQQLTEFYVQSNMVGNKDNEIKGQIGSPGKTQGIVRIVLNAKKDEHFEDNDILVTGMTRPEFVPLMKRASAIVTDEGGITCHAAIVAREMNKPCVIGTKIATQVLHDGDLVEVNADKGIVRILEKMI